MLNRAETALKESGIAEIWLRHGCEVRTVGSMVMDLMGKHRDIDLHVYSETVTEESSFAIAAEMAKNSRVSDIKCINGLHTDEQCVAWHVNYRDSLEQTWQIDIIHIVSGSRYDGYFERMAKRIVETTTDEQRHTILRLKFETPDTVEIHGVEYYEAVIADGITTIPELLKWVEHHRKKTPYYWIP